MFQKFVTIIRKWAGLPLEDFTNLLKWSDASGLQIENPNVLVAKATDAKGKAIGYLTAEPVFIVGNYAVDPRTTPSDTQQIGDSIDAALEQEARKIGADRFLIVLPDNMPHELDEVHLRVVYRPLPKAVTITMNDGSTVEKRLSINPHTQSAEWCN